jgi:hypothetical protein
MRKKITVLLVASFLILTLSQPVVAELYIKPESDVLYTTVHIKGHMKGENLIIPLDYDGYSDVSDVILTHISKFAFELIASVVEANLIIELPAKMPAGFYDVEAVLYF